MKRVLSSADEAFTSDGLRRTTLLKERLPFRKKAWIEVRNACPAVEPTHYVVVSVENVHHRIGTRAESNSGVFTADDHARMDIPDPADDEMQRNALVRSSAPDLRYGASFEIDPVGFGKACLEVLKRFDIENLKHLIDQVRARLDEYAPARRNGVGLIPCVLAPSRARTGSFGRPDFANCAEYAGFERKAGYVRGSIEAAHQPDADFDICALRFPHERDVVACCNSNRLLQECMPTRGRICAPTLHVVAPLEWLPVRRRRTGSPEVCRTPDGTFQLLAVAAARSRT